MGEEPLRRAAPGAGRPGPPAIPGYRIEAVLGRGATGVVYRAVQLSVGRPVALKVLHESAVRSEKAVRRLEREARVAALLAHPSIISAIDMGRSGGTYWFAMELVEGPSLAERLEHGGRLSERDALRLFMPLADALQHACEKGVVHRDVKPANILLEPSGRPRLVDLGLARVDDDPALTRTGGTLGTPYYISPEQARDPGAADIRADIWSLGATLYHAVCGRPPFAGQGAAEILSQVLYQPIPDPRGLRPELSRGLALVIRKCLSRDPDRRYFTPAELREDLERIAGHRAPAVRESQLEPSAESGRARRLGRGVAIAAAAAALLALMLWRPWARATGPDPADAARNEPYAPLGLIAAELERPGHELAPPYHQLLELEPRLPEAERARWTELYATLHAQLRDALWRLRRDFDPELESALAEHRFRAFDARLEREWPLALGERTGFSPQTLPDALRAGLEQWRAQWAARRDHAYQAALGSIAAALARHVDDVLAPRIERLAAEARWSEARGELEGGAFGRIEAAGARRGELTREELAPLLAPVETRLQALLVRLEEAWRALDQDLARRVRELAREAGERLRARQGVRVVEGFDAALRAELARRGLRLETWPGAPLRSELPELVRREREALVELEAELLVQDARALLAESLELAAPWNRERRFDRARAFWAERAEDPRLEPLQDRVHLRLEEARVLERLLLAAARGVVGLARAGRTVTLQVGTIRAEGRIDAGSNVLEEGFRFRLEGGSDALRGLRLVGPPDSQVGGTRLLPAAVESLAERDPELVRDLDHHLARAWLRFHEGDAAGARAVLVEERLSPDDALVHDLALAIDGVLGEGEAARERRRGYAERRTRELDAFLQHASPRRGLELVQELLGDYADVLSADQTRLLRERRRELRSRGTQADAEAFSRLFGADEVELRGSSRVRLRWRFDGPETGAWRPGPWRFDGRGWTVLDSPADIPAMVERGGAALALGEPLAPTRGASELSLELEQLWPPRLLVVTLAGFHAALASAPGAPTRLVCDITSPEDVAQRAAAGQGQTVSGLRQHATHTLTLRAHPSRGTLEVRLDGIPLHTQVTTSPRLDPPRPTAALYSLEPLRLLAADLEAPR